MLPSYNSCLFALLLAPMAAVGARTFDKSNITLSAVVAAPAGWPLPVNNKNWTEGHFDLNSTVEYGVKLMAEARSNGADLVAFPELWFPGSVSSFDGALLKPAR